jgi:hypothetical protein
MNSYILVDRPFMMLIPGRAYSCPQNAVVKLPVGVKLVMNYNCGFVVEASHQRFGMAREHVEEYGQGVDRWTSQI